MNPLVMALMAAARQRQSQGPLVYESVITPADFHIATKDGEAMFFHDSIDFSDYAGTDAGSTPYKIILTDGSGLKAEAWAGAAGGGEALGSESITSWTNWSSGPFETFTANVNNHDIDSAINTLDSGIAYSNSPVGENGRLCYVELSLTLNSGANPFIRKKSGSTYSGELLFNPLSAGVSSKTYTITNDFSGLTVQAYLSSSDFSMLASFKIYTDIPATGLHLMSSMDGTTRNMASVETGFNPNNVTYIEIYG